MSTLLTVETRYFQTIDKEKHIFFSLSNVKQDKFGLILIQSESPK